MAKYAELEACVSVSVSGMIAGESNLTGERADEKSVKGGECRKSSDIEEKEVTAWQRR